MSDHALASFSVRNRSLSSNTVVQLTVLGLAAVIAFQFLTIHTSVHDAMSTDDAMRLVEVRDLINGQGWFDLRQYRLNPPGLLMHWSRLIDLPLAAAIVTLKPLLGSDLAESVTLFVWPLLLFGVALVSVLAIARRMSNYAMNAQMAAVMLALLAKPALVHFRPGAIDHHNAQIDLLLLLILFASQVDRSAWKAVLAGLVASLSLAIGVEMLPPIAAICVAVAGLFIWRGSSVARPVVAFALALAMSSLALALALVPLSGLSAPVCDTLGAPLLLLTVGGGAGLSVLVGIDRLYTARWLRVVAAAGTGAVLTGLFVSHFGSCVQSPYAGVDPLVASLWLENLQETISFAKMLRLGPEEVPGFYGFPLVALVLALTALARSKPAEQFSWTVGIVALAALFGISLWEMRGAGGAAMVAAPLSAAAMVVIWPSMRFGRSLVLLALLGSSTAFTAFGHLAKPVTDAIFTTDQVPAGPVTSGCLRSSSVAILKKLPTGRVMAPIDLGPAILAETDHDIFAAPYHRNNAGNLLMLESMLAPPSAALKQLSDHQVDYLVLCSAAPDDNIIRLAPGGLNAALVRGELPGNLEPIDLGPEANISAWRVKRQNTIP
jgi:hypothetical protein